MAQKTLMANKNAFNAYRIIYYPIFGKNGILPRPDHVDVNQENLSRALTVQKNFEGTPYRISDASIAALAAAYQVIDDDPRFENFFDPAAAARKFSPDLADVRPMYPDFPSQVLEISEEEFRTHQALHYLSTYGVELFFNIFGISASVTDGYMPDMEDTDKVRDDVKLIDKQIVEIVLSVDEMRSILVKDLARPVRMHPSATALAAEILTDLPSGEKVAIAFHENMLSLVDAVRDSSANDIQHVLDVVCQHPGDVFKIVLHWLEKEDGKKNHLATRQKKAVCRALENFDSRAIARNLADGGDKTMFAAAALSLARFAGENLKAGKELVVSGEVQSWNAEVEIAWTAFENGHDGAEDALLAKYSERPGMLLRSMTRLVKGGVSEDKVTETVSAHADSYSAATLVRLVTKSYSKEVASSVDWRGRSIVSADEQARREEQHEVMGKVASIVREALFEKMKGFETPIAGKKVFCDTTGFSMSGSVVMPNDTGNTSDAYPPAGMAYDVPTDKTVRFFTFWDHKYPRVDVDAHFNGKMVDGRNASIGWNKEFRESGMVFSGDITTSNNSVEYLDINMPEAKSDGVAHVTERLHIFCGARNWGDIDKCFAGALIVGNTEPSTRQYLNDNVLFHDDLTGAGREMDYAYINVPDHYVRILRGADYGFEETEFSLGNYMDMLFAAQEVQLVVSREAADVVLSIGRSDDPDAICLIDEGFFIE